MFGHKHKGGNVDFALVLEREERERSARRKGDGDDRRGWATTERFRGIAPDVARLVCNLV